MKTETHGDRDARIIRETIKCSCCERTLSDPREWVRSRKSVMCVACYESLLNPFAKCCSGGAAL